jgi:hypothetical protein
MIRALYTLLSAVYKPARPGRVSFHRHLPTLRGGRTRLQVEALEERCLLSWGSIPPATISPGVPAVAVALNTRGDADISGNEVDYYAFDVPVGTPPATYVISASTPTSNLDTVLGVYDANGLRIAFNDDVSSTNFDSAVRLFLPSGQRYYFGITKLAGTAGGTYTWAVDGPADFFENNDALATASDLGTLTEPRSLAGLTLVDDADWYRFTMNGVGTSTDQVAIGFTHSAGDLQLELTDAAGAQLGESVGMTDTEAISLEGLAAGTYYVHVYGRNGAINSSFYTLDIDPGTAPVSPIVLDASGSGSGAGMIKLNGLDSIPDVIEFRATVSGRVSILMRAENQFMQSLLTSPAQGANQAFVAGQFDGTRDHLIQLDDVVAGTIYQFSANVFNDPDRVARGAPPHVGAYQLFLSTEPSGSDFSATTPTVIPLDASGSALQLGTLETEGDIDLFSFTATVTGRTTVRVDGGAGLNQVVHLLTTPGQSYAVRVFDADNFTGVYALTITSIADDFPDSVVVPVALDDTGSGNRKGSINYAGDVDVYRFTATRTGTMTVRMQGRPGVESISTLVAELSVTPTPVDPYQISPFHPSPANQLARDRIVQFQVVAGRQYTVRASGAGGTSGAYLLSFAMPVDDNAGDPKPIQLPFGEGRQRDVAIQLGSIETPLDQDRFEFSMGKDFEGFVVIALEPLAGTGMQGLLEVPSMPAMVGTDSDPDDPNWQFVHFGAPSANGGILFQAFSGAGWLESSRAAFLGFFVKPDTTYEFLVSGNQTTIGEYRLTFATYLVPAGTTEQGFGYGRDDRFEIPRSTIRDSAVPPQPPALGVYHDARVFQIAFTNQTAPSIEVFIEGVAPAPETGKATGPTNTQLAVFALPAATPSSPTVTVPSGQAAPAANSLITTLLVVAARDNAVRPTESVVSSQGTTDVAATLFAALLTGVISPATGGTDAAAAPPISGTVFEDLDGNGRLDAGEQGLAGEKVVLETLKDGQYVVVATALTDAKGAYSFAEVPAGDYRVRRLTESGTAAGPATSTSYPVKVTGDGKPKTLDFGKSGKRGRTSLDLPKPGLGGTAAPVAWHEEPEIAPELGQVFQDWCDLDEPDDASRGWWLALLPLASAVALAHSKPMGDASHACGRKGATGSAPPVLQ